MRSPSIINSSRILIACHLAFLWSAEGLEINRSELGDLLSYPSDLIMVSDVTTEERELYATPTLIEHRDGLRSPVDPENLLSSYRITSSVPSSFLPILVTIAKSGTFLSVETRDLVETLARLPDSALTEGGRGPFGDFSVRGSSMGGFFIGDLRVPSGSDAMRYPRHDTAIISELRLPDQKIDIRVAMLSNPDEGIDITAVEGGERYFEAFGNAHQEPTGDAAPEFDVAELFRAINNSVIKEVKRERAAATQSGKESLSDQDSNIVNGNQSGAPKKHPSLPFRSLPIWMGLGAGFCVLLLVFSIIALRKRQS